MTILTPELVDEIEERIYLFAVLGHAIGTTDALLASHRAQAAEIERLEKHVKELETANASLIEYPSSKTP